MTSPFCPESEQVAVIAVACRFPGANTDAQLWANLLGGVECITTFTPEQLRERGVTPEELASPRFVPAGGVVEGVEEFDAELFGVSARHAALMDPQQRKLLECVFEALETSGYARRPAVVGIYAGAGIKEHLLENLPRVAEPTDRDVLFGTDIAATVSRHLDLQGPSLTVESCCTTGLLTLHLAAQAVLAGECEVALAGASEVSPSTERGYRATGSGEPAQYTALLSSDGRCRSFDAKAAGTVPSGGVAVVALKRLSQAIDDRDFIHGVIRGSAINHNGRGGAAIAAQVNLVSEALAVAGVSADKLQYVEGQGMASLSTDAVEVRILTEAFRAQTDRTGYCALGCVRPNLGHLGTSSGFAMLLKAMAVLRHKQVPPLLHFEQQNPALELEDTPFRIHTRAAPLPVNGAPARAGLGFFGDGTSNAYLVLEEPPPRPPARERGRATRLLLLSAATPAALARVQQNLLAHLQASPEAETDDIVFSQSAGRRPLPYRRALRFKERSALCAALAADGVHPPVGRRPTLVFLLPPRFTASGFVSLYEREPAFRAAFDRCRVKLEESPELKDLLDPGADAVPFTCAAQCALAELLREWGAEPDEVVSVGAGAHAAAYLRGALTFEDAMAQAARAQPGDESADLSALRRSEGGLLLELGEGEQLERLGATGRLSGLPERLPALGVLNATDGLLDAAGRLWELGVDIDAAELYRHQRRQRLPLPGYPFERAIHSLRRNRNPTEGR